MLIRIGYELSFTVPAPATVLALLHVHPSRVSALRRPDALRIDPRIAAEEFTDWFGNTCSRFSAPAGHVRLWSDALIEDSGQPDPVEPEARQHEIGELPHEALRYLLSSRYCEVDLLSDIAWQLFGSAAPGWPRVQAICDWVCGHVRFGYEHARATRTAYETFREGAGVCRDFQHLAATFCRCMGIPARYATGYLGDIGIPPQPYPMDFSAWFEVFLGGRWYAFDARHNTPRIGRILMAVGRDAADAALTTSFGAMRLEKFAVWTDEMQLAQIPVPLP